jgi:dTDP-4-amino-4,6-dideoxygalactose transaminase
MKYDSSEACNYQYVVVTVDAARSVLQRDELVQLLSAENVLARRYFTPGAHRMRAYSAAYADVRLPVTERLAESVLCLPTGTAVAPADVTKICDVLRVALAEPERVRARLKELR